MSRKAPFTGEVGILARILGSVGGDASLKRQKWNNGVYHIKRLETVYFFPKQKYLSECVKLSDAKDYLEGSNYKQPVYLINGLKIAWGTTIEMMRGREIDAGAKSARPFLVAQSTSTSRLISLSLKVSDVNGSY